MCLEQMSSWRVFFLAQIMIIINFTEMIFITHHCILSCIVVATFLLILKIQLWQISHLSRTTFQLNIEQSLSQTIPATIRTYLFVFKCNKYFGDTTIVFLLINVPLNCIVLMYLLFIDLNTEMKLFLLVILLEQSVCIFCIHYLFVLHNLRIKNPIKPIIGVVFRHAESIELLSKIRHSLFIQTFHTKNSYGVTYGKFGLISVGTFFKVSQQFNLYFLQLIFLLFHSLWCFTLEF